jgi:predicted pyridoxine 5'-phosphate oxidase superfamily flavin-nucleotide-binding protein
MDTRPDFPNDIAFTPTVKAVQTRKGSRHAYARMEEGGSWETAITDDLKDFIEARDSAFLATANIEGQPYVQHRGGPAGFLHVLDAHTVAFADFDGNRQFISTGNLEENSRAQLFLIDHEHRRRIKIWGEARVVEGDAGLMARLMPAGYPARAQQAILFTVNAWDANCPKHIPQRFGASAVAAMLADRDRTIAALESALQRCREIAHPTRPAIEP